ncbi:MAG: flagellin [Planctomycetota bacterium]
MALTVTNANTLSLLNILNNTTSLQSNSLQKLSTGSRINRGADDPAGLIVVQSLSSELVSTEAALANNQRAKSLLGTADSALAEVASLISTIQSLAAKSTSSGGLTNAEIAANQAQIDNAISSIDRIIGTTQFNGKRLLDGSQSIRATASAPTEVTDIRVYSRPTSTTTQDLAVSVVAAGAVASGTLVNGASVVSAASVSITGSLGTATISIAAGDTLAQIAAKVVTAANDTGVSATVVASSVRIQSRGYGESAFVSASYISGDSDFATGVSYTKGTDAQVTVGGQNAFVDGLRVSYNASGFSGEFTLTATGNAVGSAGNVSISGGGATFQLGTTSNTQATIGFSALFAQNLGDSVTGYLNTLKSGGTNDLSNNPGVAASIAKVAGNQVATQQGRIGGFQNFQVETSINSLNSAKEQLTNARSIIKDVDFAAETAELSRQNVLLQSAVSLLGVASQQSAQILSLLR